MKNPIALPKYFRKDSSIKTVEITGREWFDKVNGNSYNSVQVIVNQGLKNEFSFKIGIQYGYGDYYIQSAVEQLVKMGAASEYNQFFRLSNNNKFKLFTHITRNCRKSEVKEWGI